MINSFKTFKKNVEIALVITALFIFGAVCALAYTQRQNELLQEQLIVQQRTIDAQHYQLVVLDARVQLNEKRLYQIIDDFYGKKQLIPFLQGMVFAQE